MEKDRAQFVMMIFGVYVYGALAISGLLVLAVHSGNKTAGLLAVASAGFAYVAQIFGASNMVKSNAALAVGSLLCGISSFALLMGLI